MANITQDTFTDPRDGKVYKTVKIGENIWMAENLAYAIGGRYYEDNHEYGKKYRMLYDWNAAMKACPEGWHLPDNREWISVAAKKIKAKSGWYCGKGKKGNDTDDFGFAALPGGLGKIRNGVELFEDVGHDGYWWSRSDKNGWYACYWCMYPYNECLKMGVCSKKSNLFSVRCVKN